MGSTSSEVPPPEIELECTAPISAVTESSHFWCLLRGTLDVAGARGCGHILAHKVLFDFPVVLAEAAPLVEAGAKVATALLEMVVITDALCMCTSMWHASRRQC